ncbi:MAG: hypothetical protein COB04_12400 [Gammaproteobacteria bacterium]|nr:MAG: hypothetical protein COB04_12400 [Gammaproteobacteria bacterium]
MKLKFIALLLINFAGMEAALSEPMRAELVAYSECSAWMAKLDSKEKTQHCIWADHTLTFVVNGENISALKGGSLRLSKFELDGNDLRYDRLGNETYTMGIAPLVDSNGKYAILEIHFKSTEFGRLSSVVVEGTVELSVGEQLRTKEVDSLNIDDKFSIQAGPITASRSAPTKYNQSKSLGFDLIGNMNAFVSLIVSEDSRALKNIGSWGLGDDKKRSYSFTKPLDSKVDVRLTYWAKVRQVTVPISLSPKHITNTGINASDTIGKF